MIQFINFRLAISLLALAFFLSQSIYVFSQSEAKKGVEIPKYSLKWSIPATIVDVYKLTETTTVTRKLSDSSEKKYQREYSIYFSLKAPDGPKKGFLTVEVSIDSLFYKFTEDKAVYEFNSQADNPGATNFEDLKTFSVPLGKNFDMIYSPYGNIAEIKGESLDWLRNYVNEQGKGSLDSASTFLWLDGISNERLSHICDVKKLIFPEEAVYKDSLWPSSFAIQINGMNYYDTLKAKVSELIEGYKTIEATTNNLKPLLKPARFYGIKGQLLTINSGKGTGKFVISLTPKGTVRRAEADFKTEITSKVHRDPFTEQIQYNAVWELLGQFKN